MTIERNYAIRLQLRRLVIGFKKIKVKESVLDRTSVESPSRQTRSFAGAKIPARLRVDLSLTIFERDLSIFN